MYAMGWQQSSVCSAARRGEAARVPWDGIQACVQQQMREEGARVPWDGSRAACVQQQGVGRLHVCHGMVFKRVFSSKCVRRVHVCHGMAAEQRVFSSKAWGGCTYAMGWQLSNMQRAAGWVVQRGNTVWMYKVVLKSTKAAARHDLCFQQCT